MYPRLPRQQIRGNRDEPICRELVGNAADPARQPEDFVYDDDDRGALPSFRVDHPGADAVVPGSDHDPLTVAG
jgi:hypothetical protein